MRVGDTTSICDKYNCLRNKKKMKTESKLEWEFKRMGEKRDRQTKPLKETLRNGNMNRQTSKVMDEGTENQWKK